MSRLIFPLIVLLLLASAAAAAEPDSEPAAAPAPRTTPEPVTAPTGPTASTDPNYRLSAGDTIAMSIFSEPDLAATQTIARSGEVRFPLIGEITLAGKSVREAERLLETTYKERQFLKEPVVNLVVTSYFPREVSVLGAVRAPGTVVFPRDVTSLDVVDVITRVGGFLPIAKSDAVTITHRTPDGKETVITVDLENTITGRRRAGQEQADCPIFPGDRIWVPERLF